MIYLVDANYLLHRCMNSQGFIKLTHNGMFTGAAYGFIRNILASSVDGDTPDQIICAWDSGHSERRKKIYPEYKQRPSMKSEEIKLVHDMEYYEAFNMSKVIIRDVCETLHIKHLELDHAEADDIIGYISTRYKDKKFTIFTDDYDYLQLVSENVDLIRPMASQHITLENFTAVTEGYDNPMQALYYKALCGDSSDNIPGISGFGGSSIWEMLSKVKITGKLDHDIKMMKEFCKSKNSARFDKFLADEKEGQDCIGARILIRNLDLVDISLEEFTDKDKLDIESCLMSVFTTMKSDMTIVQKFVEYGMNSLCDNLVHNLKITRSL